MNQLAIESTGRTGSVALVSGSSVLKSIELPRDQRTAATLAGSLQEAINWCDKQRLAIDFVSVADGPGSFTGLRIGVMTAKTLCYAKQWRLVAVDSVAAIAALVLAENLDLETVLVGINAYRGQVFAGSFNRNLLLPGPVSTRRPETGAEHELPRGWSAHPDTVAILDKSQWDSRLSQIDAGVALAGDPGVFPECLMSAYVARHEVDAVGVALLADYAARLDQWVDPIRLTPRYLDQAPLKKKRDPT